MIAAAVLAVPVGALATQGWSVNRLLNTCIGQERDKFPELERVAAEVLRETDVPTRRYSGCEDQGQPDPAVIADVLTWTDRATANEVLTALGWEKVDDVTFDSPDGEFSAHVVMTGEDRGSRFVTLYFLYA